MLFLVDSYELTTNSQKQILRVLCVLNDEATNILWFDASGKVVPSTIGVLNSTYDVPVEEDDKVIHVQNHKLTPKLFDNLKTKSLIQ